MNEFQLIARYFSRPAKSAVLGVGDDCALVEASPGNTLAVSTDMLVEGTHFRPGTDPEGLGHKALAVNLSDLAAMGATPRWALLSLALPKVDEPWLDSFSRGLYALADEYSVELVGGDTTRGPLNLSLTVMGEIPAGKALRRDAARVGDDIWVSGTLGDAALGLAHLQGQCELDAAARTHCLGRLERPTPRIALGLAIRDVAHAAIDISDGFLADLGHILERSQVGAEIQWTVLPCSLELAAVSDQTLVRRCVLAGGDDYELCFTAPPLERKVIAAIGERLGVRLSRVGSIVAHPVAEMILMVGEEGNMTGSVRGFDHFGAP